MRRPGPGAADPPPSRSACAGFDRRQPTEATEACAAVTPGGLFLAFLVAGLSGFGGALVWIHRAVVLKRRWMSEVEFASALSLCQLLPGPIVVNLAVHVGARYHGFTGACAAFLGLLLAPCAVAVMLAAAYSRYGHLAVTQSMLAGTVPAAMGLLLTMGIRLAAPLRRSGEMVPVAIAAFVGVVVFRLPVVVIVLTIAPLSLLLARLRVP
jgi:chromate transporter